MADSAEVSLSRRGRQPGWLVLPALGWFVAFLLVPLGFISVYSLATKGVYGGIVYQFGPQNYLRAADPIYLKIVFNSLKLALFTTVSCLLLGFPLAWVIATSRGWLKGFLLAAVVIPFWTNFVVRAYAVKLLLSEHGPVSALLSALGLIVAPMDLGNNELAVWIGMVTNYLPFLVLPLYVTIDRFDFTLIEAARDLGASAPRLFWQVVVPLTRPGWLSGAVFVFTPALGEFVIPDLLGGARTMLVGNLITDQFLKSRDWPFGSAIALLLMAAVMISLWIQLREGGDSTSKAGARA